MSMVLIVGVLKIPNHAKLFMALALLPRLPQATPPLPS